MLLTILAAASMGFSGAAQEPPPPAAGDPVALEDIVVTGRRLDDLVRNFVGEVAEPNRGRGLARWRDRVCVGVANLKTDAAQYISDRVSTVAEDIGIGVGGPGCTPNILVVATDDGAGLAQELVGERKRAFRMGGSGMDRGGVALDDFQTGVRPVRWWQMAIPVDSETGARAVRIPGECRDACEGPMDYAPMFNRFAASRLSTQIVDNLSRAIVIVDVDELGDVSILQLADYIAMVSLAQIDPDADTTAYASILNVFEAPSDYEYLTNWDKAYLEGLYSSEQTRLNQGANRLEIADSIMESHQRLRNEAGGND